MRRDRLEDRRRSAKERQFHASQRNPEYQLMRLNDLLGEGKGALRERVKLLRKLEKELSALMSKKQCLKRKRLQEVPDKLTAIDTHKGKVWLRKEAGLLFPTQGSTPLEVFEK